MKHLALYFFLLFTTLLSAQNWQPINTSKKVTHFLGDFPLRTTSFGGSAQFHPIQSIVIDSIYAQSGDTIVLFKRGFSITNYNNMLKGRIIGDTMIIKPNFTAIKTIDTNGFDLHFPASLHVNQSWILGISSSKELRATVDSIRWDSIPNFAYDSIATISIDVYNLSNQADTSHPFNGTIKISKSTGLVNTIDFVEMLYQRTYKLFKWEEDTITASDLYNLNIGDEIGYSTSKSSFFSASSTHNMELISDSTSGQVRTLRYKDEFVRSYRNLNGPNPIDTTYPLAIDTTSIQINVDSVFAYAYSGVVEDTISSNTPIIPLNFPQFLVNKAISDSIVIMFSSNALEVNSNNTTTYNAYKAIVTPIRSTRYLGISDEFLDYVDGRKYLNYFKLGNFTYGNKPILVGLSENIPLDSKHSLSIYPNPVNEELNISIDPNDIQTIVIYNAKGQIILNPPASKQIDLSSLSPGIYFIRILTNQNTFSNKFIKK